MCPTHRRPIFSVVNLTFPLSQEAIPRANKVSSAAGLTRQAIAKEAACGRLFVSLVLADYFVSCVTVTPPPSKVGVPGFGGTFNVVVADGVTVVFGPTFTSTPTVDWFGRSPG